jgi:hypothetical protein
MTTISDLSLAIIKRVGAQRLVELTNESGTATTIDSEVLDSACADAIGEFQRIVGVTADANNLSHVSILIQGIIFFLEDYKARDGGIMTSHGKRFYASCKSLREAAYISPTANSQLKPSTEAANTLPDMDKSRLAFSGYRKNSALSEVSE